MADPLEQHTGPKDNAPPTATVGTEHRPTHVSVLQQDDELTADRIVQIVRAAGTEFFRDELGTPCAIISMPAPAIHRETWPISSRPRTEFRRCIRTLVRQRTGHLPTGRALVDAAELMDALADEANEIRLANRVADDNGTIYIDMADSAWRAIKVEATGWQVVRNDQPRFRRHRHQLALPEPLRGGDVSRLFDFIPVNDASEQLLLLAWLTAVFHPSTTKPILLQLGQPGSAKTTRTEVMRALVDPCRTGPLGEIEKRNLVQVLFHHAVPSFDNLGLLTRRDADFFCRAVTGNGIERRKLFTDADEVILSFRRAIILNAIDLPTTRSDFLDRALILRASRLESFKQHDVLLNDFERLRPLLLGGLLDLLVATLQRLPATQAATEFRMADFASFGRAVASALGRPAEDFDRAYRGVLHDHLGEAIEEDPIAQCVIKLLENDDFVEGTAAQISSMLKAVARRGHISAVAGKWPGSPRWISSRLMELTPALSMLGIRVDRLPRLNDRRLLRISKIGKAVERRNEEAPVPAGSPPPDGSGQPWPRFVSIIEHESELR